LTGTVSRVAKLLFAAGILLVGHGLQLTLLPVYAQSAGWTNGAIGLSGSAYFGVFIAGCILNPGATFVRSWSWARSRRSRCSRRD
jgi:hypothetical protein